MERGEMDGDCLTLVVPRIEEQVKPATTPSTLIEGIPWCLVAVSQELPSNSQGGKPRSLGVFVKCTYDSPEQDWSITAQATLKVLNHANPEKNYSKVFKHNFSPKSRDWGYSSFMKWKDVTDPTKGFLKDDSITLESQIKVIQKSIGGAGEIPKPSLLSVLSCPICTNEFQARGNMQPMSLICGHSFCVECLQKSCTQSKDGTVKIQCLLCNKENSSATKSNLWFPNHAMIEVIGTGLVPKSKNLCDIHKHEKSYYCFDDSILVCIYCAYHGDHSHHKCHHVDIAKEQMDHELHEHKQQIINKLSELERALLLRAGERELLQSQRSNIVKAVEDFYSKLMSTLMKQKDSLLEDLDTHTRNMDSTIETSIIALRDKCSEIKLALKEFTTWQGLCPQEALSTVDTLRCTLQSASGTKCGLNDIDMSNKQSKITLEMPSLSVLSSLEHLGRLKVESNPLPTAVCSLSQDALMDSPSQRNLFDVNEPKAKKRKEA